MKPSEKNKRQEIQSAKGLRAIAVLGVVMYHTCMPFSNYTIGYFLVTLFVFSGFFMSMHHPMTEPVTPRRWARFMTHRLARFLPLYWLSLALVIIFGAWTWRWDLPLHILLLQSYVPNLYVAYSYNGVAWFLSSLVFCYALFPFIERWYQRHDTVTILLILLLAVAAFDLIAAQFSIQTYKLLTHTFPPMHLVEFMFGMLIYKVYQSHPQKMGTGTASFIELVVLIVVIIYVIVGTREMKHVLGFCWLIPAALTTLCLTMLHSSKGIVSRLLSIWPLQYVGQLSYKIYIFQYLVIMGTKKAIAWLHISWLDGIATRIITIIASIILAQILHKCFTLPIYQWAKTHLL